MDHINEKLLIKSTSTSSNDTVQRLINIIVCPTTGGQFEVELSSQDTVDNLRKKIARHLQITHERLKVLFKEKVLSCGKLTEHNIQDGSKVTLLPVVESGFSSTVQGTQQSIIQAIESLSDVQIDDFLSGRSPLTLALRVGDHMMFVQLQLEQSMAQNSSTSFQPTGNPSGSSLRRASHHRNSQLYNQCPSYSRCSTSQSASSSAMSHLLSSGDNSNNLLTSTLVTDLSSKSSTSKSRNDSIGIKDIDRRPHKLCGTNCNPLKRSSATPLPHAPVEKTSHLDKLATACSSLEEDVASVPATSSDERDRVFAESSNNEKHCKTSSMEVKESYQYRRASTTCGKITSGVGSLTHNGASGTSSRVLRHMQRLRRLCGAHQQCVAYSSRELASEISSIVHAAKHSSSDSSGGSSYPRRSSKSLRERVRAPTSPSLFQPSSSSQPPPTGGASIDSVTTHGPGIFSGTFSGSLHPNIQDHDGRPKRDPQTILQILTDLLSATNQYEGQTGNVGMLPQLFKEHFNKKSTSFSTTSTEKEPRDASNQPRNHRQHFRQTHQNPYGSGYPFVPSSTGALSGPYAYQHIASCKEARRNGSTNGLLVSHESCSHRIGGKCSHGHYHNQLGCWCRSSNSRRSRKPTGNVNLPRLEQLQRENNKTREKMQQLRETMHLRRVCRQIRRQACCPYSKRGGALTGSETSPLSKQSEVGNEPENQTGASLDVQIDDLSDYATDDRKTEVAHESPETVTV